MAIAASGTVSLSDLRAEFVGGSGAISFGDLYRGGSNIKAKAANNTSTNLAASVPTSGVIRFNDFYGAAKGFRKTYTATATNQNASAVFGDDYGVDYPKEIVINSGVELGATTTGEEALQIDSGLSGGLTITNNGTLSGAGGAAGGGVGGDAFEANVACTLINNGTIRAGGGGGGAGGSGGSGGTGGQGRTSYTNYSSNLNAGSTNSNWSGVKWFEQPGNVAYYFKSWSNWSRANSTGRIRWYSGTGGRGISFAGSSQSSSGTVNQTVGSVSVQNQDNDNGAASGYIGSFIYQTISTGYNYFNGGSGGSGGAGGAGGRGQGYNQTLANGSGGSAGAGGSAGGTNAGAGGSGGTGGTGGNGGGYGASGGNGATGATGNTGANGNHTNGSAGSAGSGGSSGGAAGKYIRGLSNVTFTNNGTVQGGTA